MTHSKLITAVFAAFMLLSASPIMAGYGHGMFSTDIGEMDADSDQLITFDEFKDFQIKDLRTAFDMLDTNGDNVIDQDEWNDFLRVHGVHEAM